MWRYRSTVTPGLGFESCCLGALYLKSYDISPSRIGLCHHCKRKGCVRLPPLRFEIVNTPPAKTLNGAQTLGIDMSLSFGTGNYSPSRGFWGRISPFIMSYRTQPEMPDASWPSRYYLLRLYLSTLLTGAGQGLSSPGPLRTILMRLCNQSHLR